MAHGSISRKKNRAARKLQHAARKRSMQEQYKAWAYAGITKKSRRATLKVRAEAHLAKDNKQVNVAAVLARPIIGKPSNWVNRKAVLIDPNGYWPVFESSGIRQAARLLGIRFP